MQLIGRFLCLVLASALSPLAGGQQAASPAAKSDSQRDADVGVLTDLACKAGRAYATRDTESLDQLTADDYVQTDVRGGVLSRTQWLDFVKNRKSELKVDCDSVEVHFYAGTAVVTGNWTYIRLGQESKPAIRSRWTSVWTMIGGTWKRHVFQNTYINPNADHCAVEEAH